MQIIINKCFGGFGVSRKALHRLRELKNKYALNETDCGEFYKDKSGPRGYYLNSFLREIPRNDKDLIKVFKEMPDEISAPCASLKLVSIPAGVKYEIDDYDGMETIHEKHRVWE